MEFTVTETYTVIHCFKCHSPFGMNDGHYRQRKEDQRTFWCPSCGKSQYFVGETEAQRERRLRELAERRMVQERQRHDQTHAKLRTTERRRRSEKAAKTRLKNKIAKGFCPCCHRYFSNLHQHMETQHPDFTEQD